MLADYAASLGPLGAPTEFTAGGESLRGGMVIRSFRIRAGGVTMDLTTMTLPDGKIDQYIVARAGESSVQLRDAAAERLDVLPDLLGLLLLIVVLIR